MGAMFTKATSFNQEISSWDGSFVTHMDYIFKLASSFDQDISPWDVSSVTTMQQMFQDATVFDQNLCSGGNNTIVLTTRLTILSTSDQDINAWYCYLWKVCWRIIQYRYGFQTKNRTQEIDNTIRHLAIIYHLHQHFKEGELQ
mmetsp:Transcript_18263/g.45264  ORF Transcript_18263/g.45264 Transcript_18263/m.45264 type:complete len:143 (-) Transcript_18263:458-886(-)